MKDVEKVESRIAHIKGLRALITEDQKQVHEMLREGGVGPEESRHLAIARTALEDAAMRLGKALQAIGEAHPGLVRDPYPTSRDPAVTTIDATALEVSGPLKQP